jgi:hypothetical protein
MTAAMQPYCYIPCVRALKRFVSDCKTQAQKKKACRMQLKKTQTDPTWYSRLAKIIGVTGRKLPLACIVYIKCIKKANWHSQRLTNDSVTNQNLTIYTAAANHWLMRLNAQPT